MKHRLIPLAVLTFTASLACAQFTPTHVYESQGYAGTNSGFHYFDQVNEDISGPYAFDDTVSYSGTSGESASTRRQGSFAANQIWLKVSSGSTVRSSCGSGLSFNFTLKNTHVKLYYNAWIQQIVWWDDVIVRVYDVTNSSILYNKQTVTEAGTVDLAVPQGHTLQLYVALNQNNLLYAAGNTSFVAEGKITPLYVPVTLAVRSTNPASGVHITSSPADLGGKTSCDTPSNLSFDTGMTPSLVAPSPVGSSTFLRWELDGAPLGSSILANVNMGAAHTLTAVYSPGPSSVKVSPNPVIGGQNATGTVVLTGYSPSPGTDVNLSSDDPNATVPAKATVATKAMTATFLVTTKAVDSAEIATISAQRGGTTVTTQLTINPAAVSKVLAVPSTVVGGNGGSLYIYLNGKAGPSGAEVSLTSGTPSVASMQSSVTVPAGLTSAKVPFTTQGVDATKLVNLSAQIASSAKAATVLTVNPAGLSKILTVPSLVVGGAPSSLYVYLNGKAGPSGATVNFSSDIPSAASMQVSGLIPAQSGGQRFAIASHPVDSLTVVTFSASIGGGTIYKATLSVKTPSLARILMVASVVRGGTASHLYVYLDRPAGPSGVTITLSNDDPQVVEMQPTGVIPAGLAGGSFQINTFVVPTTHIVTISAKIGSGTPLTATLTVKPT